MAYSFYGFIGPKAPVEAIGKQYAKATIVELPQNLFVIPLVDELAAEMNNVEDGDAVEEFYFLSRQIEAAALAASQHGTLAYAEVLLSAGQGDQDGIIWKNGERIRTIRNDQVINSILEYFGAIAEKGEDEFLTLGFGLRRFTEDWIDE